jgi:RND family efflux transporter MFP subunit
MNFFEQIIWRIMRLALAIRIALAALVVLTILALCFCAGPRETAEVAEVKKGEAISAVYGTVSVEPIHQVIVKSQTAGVIDSLKVQAGEMIDQGALLMTIGDPALAHELKTAQVNLESALQRKQIGPSSASKLASKEAQLREDKRLLDEGNIAAVEYNRVVKEVEELRKAVEQEKLTIEQEIEQSRSTLGDVKTRIDQGTIKSPLKGTILDIYSQLGEAVLAQTQLLKIGSEGTHLKAMVNEEDVGQLSPGMKAVVKLYSFGGDEFQAVVREILPSAINRQYSVILQMSDKPPGNLMPGMTGELNIIVGRRDHALIVPTRAIRSEKVLVVSRGRIQERKVLTGYANLIFAEIREGLREGELVVLSDHDRYSSGQRVRVWKWQP